MVLVYEKTNTHLHLHVTLNLRFMGFQIFIFQHLNGIFETTKNEGSHWSFFCRVKCLKRHNEKKLAQRSGLLVRKRQRRPFLFSFLSLLSLQSSSSPLLSQTRLIIRKLEIITRRPSFTIRQKMVHRHQAEQDMHMDVHVIPV